MSVDPGSILWRATFFSVVYKFSYLFKLQTLDRTIGFK